jgi:anti-sigma factor RsiW
MGDPFDVDGIRQHSPWLDLVAPYLDGELSAASHAEMDAHVAACTICQRELAQQRAVSQRLRQLASEAAPIESLAQRLPYASTRKEAHSRHRAWAWTGWGLAAAQAIVLAVVFLLPTWQARHVPMVEEAVADYQRVVAGELPFETTNIDALSRSLSLSVDVLKSPQAQLLGACKTVLRDKPAAALAYRVDNHVVIQYVVSGPLFFAQSSVREAVSRQGHFASQDDGKSVIGWPGTNAGFLLVGELPTEKLVSLSL